MVDEYNNRYETYSQGGVQVPTGGIPVFYRGARERSSCLGRGQQNW
ncbi:hypothetical protein SpAn4DRAFT_3322 [Sporomusa ovata]|uniref:Uncharacterized protein n=1 Tax=Sporomusa ovata TaxID=2378 RepID=A0A0U1KZM2_9FIRM|nr:hypothetical protein SpAn4DRAFT_3322 [Sporomusa ovata]